MEMLITLKKKASQMNNLALYHLLFTDQNLGHKEACTCKLYTTIFTNKKLLE